MKSTYCCIGLLSAILCLTSCIKDTGNYKYKTGNTVTLKFTSSTVTIYLGDTLRLNPIRTFSNPQDTTDFDHAWYLNGVHYSDSPTLVLPANTYQNYMVNYYMTDRKTGIAFTASTSLGINVSSRYIYGWAILYEDNTGHSELAQVCINTSGLLLFDYAGMYRAANGAPMGTQPVKLCPYNMRGTPGIFVIQRGDPGSIDISGVDMTRKLIASQSFTLGAPDDFEPENLAFFNSADVLVNKNGDLYGRFFNGAAAFTVPWMSAPINVTRGMKIADVWYSWFKTSNIALMYDSLNKRVLQSNVGIFTQGGGMNIDSLPAPITPYPANYTSLHNLGDWQYVWGGTFHDSYNVVTGAMLIRSPVDNQLYFETFQYSQNTTPGVLTPGARIPFTGSQQVNSATSFAAIKQRDYLFFSGGADNMGLYYFDAIAGGTKLYASFNSPIASITSGDAFQQLGVGLQDGTFILFDVSNATMLSGQPKEVHRYVVPGKIVDVKFRGTQY